MPELMKTYTVVILDLPGHGQSGVFGAVHSMEFMAEAIQQLLSELKFESFILVGHSMGGYVALAYAEKYPNQISKLILLNSTSQSDSAERKLNRNRAIKLLAQEKTGFIGMAISNLFSEHSRKHYAKDIERLKLEAMQFSTEGIIANIKGMRDRKDRTLVLKNFQHPKWIVSGTDDPIVTLEQSKLLSKNTQSTLKIVQGSHMSWLENKEEIVKMLHFIE